MSRSYTNKEGEKITVSEHHLQVATQIKKELQNASPSRKASMKKLVQMMEVEGFFDAESSEAYRCMLKNYQKSIGELPEAPKHADMIADNKLQSIKELVGEIAYEKRENQHVLKNLNKVKREVIDFTLIAEQIGEAYKNYDWSKVKFTYNEIPKTEKKMFVALTDLHIGALVDTSFNKFNYEVAQARMQQYLNKVITEIKNNDISEVYLMNLGDVIEHPYMHNLMYTSEFVMSEQIARASDLIIKFMVSLSEHVSVRVAGIAGNHDRFEENKNVNLDSDHAVRLVNYSIKSYIENSKIKRVTYEQAKDYEHSISLNGVNIKCVHGDLDNIKNENILAKHSDMDGIDYNLIVMGHFHHHRIIELGIEKFAVMFGTLKGADMYSQKVRKLSNPSQGVIIIDENGEIEIKRMKLS